MRLRLGPALRLEVDPLFVVLLAVPVFLGYPVHGLLVAGSLAAHELAHLLVAAVMGVEVESLRLSPVGGSLRLAVDLGQEPQIEVPVALAGPVQSFFLAGLGHLLRGAPLWDQALVEFFLNLNLSLGFFNLLPALPLDGGRALRGLLAHRHGPAQVTRWMAAAGRVSGVVLFAAGVLAAGAGRPLWTALVGGPLIFLEAGREQEALLYRSMRSLLRRRGGLRERRVIPARTLVALGSCRLREVLPHLASRSYQLVLVVDESLEPLGTLTETRLVEAFTHLGPEATLAALLERR
ncbi:site-2 protease family protein [Caldinitratiruptor microaerophilus]|uniref:Peptidase M50 n=1 Tax=Caldinitratiruptor microaerophilus TaxID=671077 RepID=A0AA35CPB8_9FIRM|nr:site-2 protease family protein [Caldinitratiruptor microaerophilus]BDG61467.1 peptidase M50 [Caldinitratiruptor microaerophilus]